MRYNVSTFKKLYPTAKYKDLVTACDLCEKRIKMDRMFKVDMMDYPYRHSWLCSKKCVNMEILKGDLACV